MARSRCLLQASFVSYMQCFPRMRQCTCAFVFPTLLCLFSCYLLTSAGVGFGKWWSVSAHWIEFRFLHVTHEAAHELTSEPSEHKKTMR